MLNISDSGWATNELAALITLEEIPS